MKLITPELQAELIELLELVFNYDGDVFRRKHNDAVDALEKLHNLPVQAQPDISANLKLGGYTLKSNTGEFGTGYWWVNGKREGELWMSEKDAWESAQEDFEGTALRLACEWIEHLEYKLRDKQGGQHD
jgi:hypothetical protein